MSNGSTTAEKMKWERLRTTPRGRGLVAAYVANPGTVFRSKRSNPLRGKQRATLRAAYERGLRKNAELGIAPVYCGHDRTSGIQRTWVTRSKAWDKAARGDRSAEDY